MVGLRLGFAVATLSSLTEADAAGGWEDKTDEQGRVVQQLKIEAPAMTEEDQYGYVMPDRYRCDACKAVMFHLNDDLQRKHPKNRRMKDWEYTDVFDETCGSSFSGYGIKLIHGENALSGPGLPRDDKLAAGSGAIQMSSESWSKRLREICRRLVYEKVGEDEMYEMFYRKRNLASTAESHEPGGSGAGLSPELCVTEFHECDAKPTAMPRKTPPSDEKPQKNAAKGKGERGKPAKKAPEPKKGKGGTGHEKLDSREFLQALAARHGVPPDRYLTSRTAAEWEKLFVSIAGKLFNEKSEL